MRIFSYLKNEIEEFGTPLNSVLLREGIDRGVEGLLSSVRSKSLLSAIGEARGLGRGHKKGDLRIGARIISRLEEEDEKINASLSDPEVTSNFPLLTEKCNRLEEIKTLLDDLYNEYETLI